MDVISTSLEMWLIFGVIIASVALYSYDKIPLEFSSIATVAVLLLLFHFMPVTKLDGTTLTPQDLLRGFSDPALITILALLVVGQGLVQTGALNAAARSMVELGNSFPKIVILVTFIFVMIVSGVLNNTPVVVIFIPILSVLSEKLGKKASSTMMPLSFVAILGGSLTLIGSSTNLLVAGRYTEATGNSIGFFDLTIPGLVLATVGLVYVIFIAPKLLKDRAGLANQLAEGRGKQFLFQMEVSEDSPLNNQTAIAGLFPGIKDVTIRMIQRGSEKILPPYDDITLEVGDIVQVASTRSVMTQLLGSTPGIMSDAAEAITEENVEIDETTRQVMAEAVVSPTSRMNGRTLAGTGFRAETGCSVLGIQRRSRMIRGALNMLRLEAGDTLLVMGSQKNVSNLRNNTDVLLMEWSKTELPMTVFALRAQLIFTLFIITAATGFIPIVAAALSAAILMIATGCLNVRQAARSFDRQIFAIVGAAIALGTSLQATGGAEWIAQMVIMGLEGTPNWMVLSGFFLMVALLTNVLSNNATAVLFTPIGISVAQQMGLDPMVFVIATIFAANCSFATPISYQTNLLVMAPGHYKFSDFLKAGTPLLLLLWITFSIFAPWYYGL